MNATEKLTAWANVHLRHTMPGIFANSVRHAVSDSFRYLHSLDARVLQLGPVKPAQGHVLLSYMLESFVLDPDHPTRHSHTRFADARQVAQTFLDLGYSVDVISYRNRTFVPRRPYEFFVDTRFNFERLAPLLNTDCRKILHGETSHILFQNSAESERLWALYQRRSVSLQPRRWERPTLAPELADYITLFGNASTLETYRGLKKPIYLLPVTTSTLFPSPEIKDFAACRKRYVWFGSGGMVHKGLDLVLEAFAEMPDYHLTVCGPVEKEVDFSRSYHRELYETGNIETTGWIDTRSDRFREIMARTLGLVFPSCSEGQASTVVESLHAGLIPIISYESGVDVDEFGVVTKTSGIEQIRQAVSMLSDLPAAELRSRSRRAWEFARARHTRDVFAKVYRSVIEEIVERSR
jgi:glycosyltransferase involved in cell wall biosynthesis